MSTVHPEIPEGTDPAETEIESPTAEDDASESRDPFTFPDSDSPDIVDEWDRESFPASDPPSNY